MKFTLEVELDQLSGDTVEELGRILRYWAGNLKHYELVDGTSETLMDSEYQPVGIWQIHNK